MQTNPSPTDLAFDIGSDLTALGLDRVTLDVYRSALEHPDASTEVVASKLDMPVAEVDRAVHRLRDLHLIVPTWTKPGHEHAVQPSAGLEALLQRRRTELMEQQQKLQRTEVVAATIAEQLNELLSARTPGDVEVLRGRSRASSRVAEIAMSAKHAVWALNPEPFETDTEPLDESPDRPLLERGVQIRMIYLASAVSKGPARTVCEWYRQMGGEIRSAPMLPMRLIIFDQEVAVMPIDPSDDDEGALVYSDQSVVSLAVDLFNGYWSKAQNTLADSTVTAPDALTAQERELIQLLADGATDEQVARRFGVSIRTVRRMAAELNKRTGARSRFELGVRAAQRGWTT